MLVQGVEAAGRGRRKKARHIMLLVKGKWSKVQVGFPPAPVCVAGRGGLTHPVWLAAAE